MFYTAYIHNTVSASQTWVLDARWSSTRARTVTSVPSGGEQPDHQERRTAASGLVEPWRCLFKPRVGKIRFGRALRLARSSTAPLGSPTVRRHTHPPAQPHGCQRQNKRVHSYVRPVIAKCVGVVELCLRLLVGPLGDLHPPNTFGRAPNFRVWNARLGDRHTAAKRTANKMAFAGLH
jgi:hypothetical protein